MSKLKYTPIINLRGNVKLIVYNSKYIGKNDCQKPSPFTTNVFDSMNTLLSITVPNWDIDGGIFLGFEVYHFNIGNDLYKCEQFHNDGYLIDELTFSLDDNLLIASSGRWNETKNISYYDDKTKLINFIELGTSSEFGSFYNKFNFEYDDLFRIKSIKVSEIEEKNLEGGYYNIPGNIERDEFEKIILFTYQTKDSLRKRHYNKDGFVIDEYLNFDSWGFISSREVLLIKSELIFPTKNIPFIKEFVSNLEINDGKKIYSEFYSYSNFDNKGNWLNLDIERNCFNVIDFFKDSVHKIDFQEKIIINRKIDYHK
jgi:hypothetical protein